MATEQAEDDIQQEKTKRLTLHLSAQRGELCLRAQLLIHFTSALH